MNLHVRYVFGLRDQPPPDIPVPSGWRSNIKSAVLRVVSLAHYAMAAARGWAANSIDARVLLAAANSLGLDDEQRRQPACP